jgi:hypothetical protein
VADEHIDVKLTVAGRELGAFTEKDDRSYRPVVLPEWVVRYLTENAFGQYTVAEAVLGGAHGAEEMEAAGLILWALKSPSRTWDIVGFSQRVEVEGGNRIEDGDRIPVVEVPT